MLLLDTLTARGAEIEDLTGLEYAIRVREIFLEGNQVRDVTPLRGADKLERLYTFQAIQFPICPPCPASFHSERLDLAHIPIQDLSILSNLTQLEALRASAV